MKFKAGIITISTTLLISGVIYKNLTSLNDINRTPASTEDKSCISAIRSFFKSSDVNTIRRLKQREFLAVNDYISYLEIIKNSHDNIDIKRGQSPIGHSQAKTNLTEKFMARTNSNYVPGYFQHHEDKSFDTWGIFEYLTSKRDLSTEEGQLVLSRAKEWMDSYTSYPERLEETIMRSFENKMQYEVITKHHRDHKKAIKNFNYVNGNRYTVELPFIRKINDKWETVYETQGFSTYRNFIVYLEDKKTIFENSFADKVHERSIKAGPIYEVINFQATMRRRLEFLRDKLADTPEGQLSKEQITLRDEIEGILYDGRLMPRSDAITRHQNIELRSEIKSFFKGEKSRREVLNTFHKRLFQKFSNETIEKSEMKNYIKAVLFGNTIGAVATVTVGTMALPLTENDYILYLTSSFQNWFNNLLLSSPLGTTQTLHECAKENRSWSVENVCMANFLNSHLSSYLYKSRIDEDYDYLQDPTFIEKRQKLISVFLEKREKLQYGDFFSQNMDYLKEEAYYSYAAQSFIEVINTVNPSFSKDLDTQTKEEIYQFLSDKETEMLPSSLNDKINADMKELVTDVKNHIPKAAKLIQSNGTLQREVHDFMKEH